MATHDVNLSGGTPSLDKDAEIARLREENARLAAKRDNDESSAFGRLAREAELRKQREAELAEANRKVAEFQAKSARSVLTQEQLDVLGEVGAAGVESIAKAVVAPFAAPTDSAAVLERLQNLERAQQLAAARSAYNQRLVSWATQNGAPNLLSRLSPGGDLAGLWATFAQQNPGAVAAFESGDVESTQAFVKLFMYENPAISQQSATPAASGGFEATGTSRQYGPSEWMAETAALDAQRESGQITQADWSKGYVAANAKLAATQKR